MYRNWPICILFRSYRWDTRDTEMFFNTYLDQLLKCQKNCSQINQRDIGKFTDMIICQLLMKIRQDSLTLGFFETPNFFFITQNSGNSSNQSVILKETNDLSKKFPIFDLRHEKKSDIFRFFILLISDQKNANGLIEKSTLKV